MKKDASLGIRLSSEDRTLLGDLAEEYGVKPGTFASNAVKTWLDACRAAGGFIKPEFSSKQNIYEDREKELIQMVAEELGLYKPAETKKKTG